MFEPLDHVVAHVENGCSIVYLRLQALEWVDILAHTPMVLATGG